MWQTTCNGKLTLNILNLAIGFGTVNMDSCRPLSNVTFTYGLPDKVIPVFLLASGGTLIVFSVILVISTILLMAAFDKEKRNLMGNIVLVGSIILEVF